MKNLIRILFIVLSASLFFSCGNEAKVVPPSQSNVGYVDTSPGTELLTVQAIYPENGAANVSRDTDIIIVFSKGITASTLTGNITLTQGGTPVAFTFSPVPVDGDRIIHVNPSAQLGNSLAYLVSVNTGITSSVDGTSLYATASSTFTTIDSDSGVAASQPRVLPLTRIPGTGATGISINNPYIEVTFSTAVDPATVTTTGGGTGGSFQLSPAIASGVPSPVAGTGNRTFRLPLNTAAYSTGYTVTLTNAINTGGATPVSLLINGDVTWSYTTEGAPAGLPAADIPSVWLTDITSTTAYVNWVTARPVASSSVDYGLTSGYELPVVNEPATPANTVHRIQLTGLSASRRYYFIITSDGLTRTGYFMTAHSGGATNGTLLSDPLGNETLLHAVKSTTGAGVLDGSSYVIWKNGNNVMAKYITTAGAVSWAANGEIADSGHNWTVVRSFTDSRGGLLVTGIDGLGDIRIKRIYNNAGTFAFDPFWENGTESAATQGEYAGAGTNQSAGIVWGNLVNTNVDGGTVTRLRNGTSVVLDTATYTNIFYDFDVDFTAATGIADNDVILNTSSSNANRTVANYANVTNIYRHAVNQNAGGAGMVAAGNIYVIGDIDSTDASTAVDHTVNNNGVYPPTINNSYLNPKVATPGSSIYTSHGYSLIKGGWTVDAGDIFYDGGTVYRRIDSVAAVDLATGHTVSYAGSSNNPGTYLTSVLVTAAVITTVTAGDLVQNIITPGYAEVLENRGTDLLLSDTIFTAGAVEDFNIYKRIRANGVSSNSLGQGSQVNGSGFTNPTAVEANDIVRKYDLDSYANDDSRALVIAPVMAGTLLLNSSIMSTGFPAVDNYYHVYDDNNASNVTGASSITNFNIVDDATKNFATDSVNPGHIVEKTAPAPVAFSLITERTSSTRLVVEDSMFTSAGGNFYQVHKGIYCDTHFGANMFTSFYGFNLNSAINGVDISNYTIYNGIKTGTADTLPANPLLDNAAGTDFTAATAILTGDFVFNSSTGEWTRVASNALYARALSLTNGTIFDVNGYGYYILRFNPVVPDATILATGRAAAPAAYVLNSAVASFASAKKGDLVYNVTTKRYATVVRVNSNTQLTLNKDIFQVLDEGFILFQTNERVTETGVNSSDTAVLTDASANFNCAANPATAYNPVRTGDIVHNNITGTEARVVSVDSATQLTLSADIFTAINQSYSVYQPRILIAFENSGNIYAELLRLWDGSDCGISVTVYDTASAASYPVVVSDGLGSAFVIYEISGTSIYGNKVNAAGALGGVVSAFVTGVLIDVISDGATGIYVLYENAGDVRLTRRDNAIGNIWDIPVANTAAVETDSVITIDSSGNPVVVYASLGNIYISKFNPATGATAPAPYYVNQPVHTLGYHTENSDSRKSNISMVSDNNNGIIVSWIDSRYYYPLGYTVHATFVNSAGTRVGTVWDADGSDGVVPDDYDGIQIGIFNSYNSTEPSFTMVNYNDGALPWNPRIFWVDYRVGTDSAIYYNDVNHD